MSALREMVPYSDIMLNQSATSPELSPPPLSPEMSVSRLLKTRAAGAAAADAADVVEGPGHVRLTSGTACVCVPVGLFSVLFIYSFIKYGVWLTHLLWQCMLRR